MKAIKNMVRTAQKSATTTKSATIIAMAAIAGASVQQTSAAYQDAIRDMAQEFGRENVVVEYTWNPFDGMLA